MLHLPPSPAAAGPAAPAPRRGPPAALVLTLLGTLGGALGAGCGEPEPVRMPMQGQAFALVAAGLQDLLPGVAWTEPDVRWWTELCPGTETSAVVLGRRCYSGVYYRSDGVDVAWRGTIGRSAYTHELVHYFLDRTGRGADPAHVQAEAWERALRIDEQLQNLGM